VRILLVEDEPLQAAAISRGLEAEGFSVDICNDGIEGFACAFTGSYAAIVLDVLLPGMNGYMLAQDLRRQNVWTPILLLTAKDGEYDEADAFEYGADDFLRKPYSFVVLVARLRSIIRRGATPRPALMTCGELTYDPVTRICRKGEVDIELSARETDVLEALIRRTGQIVRKADLVNEVWGPDFEGDVNVAEVYIAYLRRKIGSSRIRTVRGTGYRLVDPHA
jgi:two-component system, OmpR family, response regulator